MKQIISAEISALYDIKQCSSCARQFASVRNQAYVLHTGCFLASVFSRIRCVALYETMMLHKPIVINLSFAPSPV
jgi:hypothetical protein